MKSRTVYLDDFSDYTAKYSSSTIGDPLLPFCLSSIASSSTIYLTHNTDTVVYPSIQTCLVVTSYNSGQEVLYYHQNRLANYSYQYYVRLFNQLGSYSEGLVRYNVDNSGKEYGYTLQLGASTYTTKNQLGKIILNEVVASNYTKITTVYYTMNTTLSNMTEVNPFEWFYVHFDISGNNIQVYLSSATTPIINMTVDTTSTIPVGGVGFRANNFGANYYYERVDVQAQGSWNIMYWQYNGTNSTNNEAYVNPTTVGDDTGTIIMADSTVSALTSTTPWVTNYSIYGGYGIPTPFGDRIVYQLATPNTAPTWGGSAFAMSSCDGSNMHLIWDAITTGSSTCYNDAYFQELESIGVDGFAYMSQSTSIGRLTLPDSGYGIYSPIMTVNQPVYDAPPFSGPIISPDGSYINHMHYQYTSNGTSLDTINELGTGIWMDVYDEWLMNGLGQHDYSWASCNLTYVQNGFGWSAAGAEINPQMWEWGMEKCYWEQYGPYAGAPNTLSPTPITSCNFRNGTFSEFTNLLDVNNQSYSGYWAWPIPDPCWTGNSPYQLLASYEDPTTEVGTLYFISKQPNNPSNPFVGKVNSTYLTRKDSYWGAFNGLWWNKPD